MTAIYTVWNNYGFAFASDSNQTASQKNQTWIDPVEKIIMLKNHQIAVGAAGKSMHAGIEINEIIRSWEKFLPSGGYPMLEDYFVDFVCWFMLQEFTKTDTVSTETFISYCRPTFETFRDEYASEIAAQDASALIDTLFMDFRLNRNKLNIYGEAWEDFADPNELITNADNVNTLKRQLIENAHMKVSQKIHNLRSSSGIKIYLHISEHPDFETSILPKTLEVFGEVFGRKFDVKNEIDQLMVTFLFSRLENDLNFNPPVSFLMVGYGNDDWQPSGISFDIFSSYYNVPRIRVHDYSNPNYNWYVALAVDSAVDQLTRGHSRDRAQEILEMAKPHLKKGHVDQFGADLQEMAHEKFHSSLERLEILTLDRLEFVSRLFVQIEALKSFLDEPVPGVGGDTKVISMTKTTRREKHFNELG